MPSHWRSSKTLILRRSGGSFLALTRRSLRRADAKRARAVPNKMRDETACAASLTGAVDSDASLTNP
jgi:hypothetical protein